MLPLHKQQIDRMFRAGKVILTINEPQARRAIILTSFEQLQKTCQDILKNRIQDRWWFIGDQLEKAERAVVSPSSSYLFLTLTSATKNYELDLYPEEKNGIH